MIRIWLIVATAVLVRRRCSTGAPRAQSSSLFNNSGSRSTGSSSGSGSLSSQSSAGSLQGSSGLGGSGGGLGSGGGRTAGGTFDGPQIGEVGDLSSSRSAGLVVSSASRTRERLSAAAWRGPAGCR